MPFDCIVEVISCFWFVSGKVVLGDANYIRFYVVHVVKSRSQFLELVVCRYSIRICIVYSESIFAFVVVYFSNEFVIRLLMI